MGRTADIGPSESGKRRPPGAVIVTIGDELLDGDRTDTNARWIARFLADRGLSTVRILSVGDDPSAIAAAVSEGLATLRWESPGAALLLTTGGLGPTRDDRTRDAVSELFGRPLREDPDVRERIRERFRQMGREGLPETNRRVTRVPEGATVLPNSVGTAPGLVLEESGVRVVLLPGVPAEMRHLADDRLAPLLAEWFPGRLDPPVRRVVHTTGIPESELAARLEEREEVWAGVNLAYRPSVRGVELAFSARGPDAGAQLDRVIGALEPVLAPWRIDESDGDAAGAVLRAFREREWTLAIAESCTGGLMGARLTAVPGSSDVFLGGVVAYADRAKTELLGVPTDVIREHGAVSDAAARAMADGARDRFGSDWAVSVTGVAGPGGGTPDKPVGTVCFGIAGAAGTRTERRRFPGGRDEVRERAAQHALHRLLRAANPGMGEG